jgi:hypothetical protein
MSVIKKIAWALYLVISVALADDVPCKESGIAHCNKKRFVCNDEKIEEYPALNCLDRYENTRSGVVGDLDGDGVLSGSEQYLYDSESGKTHGYESSFGNSISGNSGGADYGYSVTGNGGVHIGSRNARNSFSFNSVNPSNNLCCQHTMLRQKRRH